MGKIHTWWWDFVRQFVGYRRLWRSFLFPHQRQPWEALLCHRHDGHDGPWWQEPDVIMAILGCSGLFRRQKIVTINDPHKKYYYIKIILRLSYFQWHFWNLKKTTKKKAEPEILDLVEVPSSFSSYEMTRFCEQIWVFVAVVCSCCPKFELKQFRK